MDKPTLYSYWRSSCSWRVRIALNLKDIDYEYKAVHLVKDGGEQNKEEYRAINSFGQVPTFVTEDGVTISQSLTIIEFLDEKYPDNAKLLPKDIVLRAKAREISEVINSGIQPIQNLSVMNKVSDDPAKRIEWSRFWIHKGLEAVEKLLESCAGQFCVGNELTIADCFLIPQVYNAQRFNVDMATFPIINRIVKTLEAMEAFVKAHPDQQPDKQ